MIRYQLSKSIDIVKPNEFQEEETPLQYQQGHYILSDRIRGKDFLINETIRYFIDKFTLPKTPQEVLWEVARDVNTDPGKIKGRCTTFINLLRKQHIVVPENWVEPENQAQELFKAGDQINNLEILELIASKKEIDIYKVQDKNDQAIYAIKLLNRQKIATKKRYKEELITLEHEYLMLQQTKHVPFICQVYGMHTDDQQNTYIQMEYIPGEPLPRHLGKKENLSQADCYNIMRDVLQTFSLLHESKLIHGDIHPANILVAKDHTIKIIDLGLTISTEVEDTEILKFGGVIYYMPPERIQSSSHNKFTREPDLYSDVYQIGLMLYFILYLRGPFKGFIWEDLSRNIKENNIAFPETSFLGAPVPEALKALIRKCTWKSPTKRYSSARAVLEDFMKIVPGHELVTA